MEVPGAGRVALGGHLVPGVGGEVACEEVVLALHAVVAALNVNVCVVLGPCGTGPDGGQAAPGVYLPPGFGLEVELVHVVEPARSVEASEEHELAIVHDAHVAEAPRGHLALSDNGIGHP